MKDITGMIRSFHYAALSVVLKDNNPKIKENQELALRAATLWYKAVSVLFLRSYLSAVSGSSLLPSDKNALSVLMDAYLLEKVIYELGYELNNRPDWISIPIKGLEESSRTGSSTGCSICRSTSKGSRHAEIGLISSISSEIFQGFHKSERGET